MKYDFINSSDWRTIVDVINKEIADKAVAILRDAKEFAEVRYVAGYIDALRGVLTLPQEILHDDEISKPDEPTDILHIAGQRKLTSFTGRG